MAEAVERAIERRGYLVAEAGTGTGKTLAYLVPAILSGRRVIISTATKTLQEQLWQKDIPLLREACGLEFEAAYLKGRSNYYCLERGAEFARAPTFAVREEAALWPRIEAWAATTTTGDRSEVDLPDQLHTWRDLSATSENCLGRECRRYDECFVTRARALAASADVLLVNHHLFFADLAMRTSRAGVEILPDHDVVMFDEAQALEDVATEYFGLQVSSYRVEELTRDALRAVADRPDLASMMKEATGELRRSGERAFQEVADALREASGGAPGRGGLAPRRGGPRGAGGFGRSRRAEPEDGARAGLSTEVLEPAVRSLARLDGALGGMRDLLADASSPALSQIARRAGELRVELAAVTAMKEPSRIYFGEVRGRGVFLRAAPIDVAQELQERLYRRTDTVIFTSATLATQGRFDYFRRQVGLAPEFEVEERLYAGPFDYPRQAALVAPDGLPEPNDAGFAPAAARTIAALTEVTGGRAFVLCTSNRNMHAFHQASRGPALPDPAPGRAAQVAAAGGVPVRALGALRHPELLGGRRRPRRGPVAGDHRPAPLRAPRRSGGGRAPAGAGGAGARRVLRALRPRRRPGPAPGVRPAHPAPHRPRPGGGARPAARLQGLRKGLPGLAPSLPAAQVGGGGEEVVGGEELS